MSEGQNQSDMPDAPNPDFVDAICEIWLGVNYAAYHLAYTRVYLQTRAMQTGSDELREESQLVRDAVQTDLIICRTHLAAFFWQLYHVFEALGAAINRGKKEYPDKRYYYSCERQLGEIRQSPVAREIQAYRNKGHELPGIIGQAWEKRRGKFLHHFLPSISGQEPKDSIDINRQLQMYFEFVVNLWLSFVPEPYKTQFPRSFKFPVTVPFSYIGYSSEGGQWFRFESGRFRSEATLAFLSCLK
jgi:hypothetical protein